MADPTNPGVLDPNTNSPTLGGSEVGANPPAVPASESDAIEVFMAGVTPLVNALDAVLGEINPAVSKHRTNIGPKQVQAIGMASAMMRTYPKLSGTTADELDAGTNDVTACTGLALFLNAVVARVNYAGRVRQSANWHVASGAIASARKQAPENGSIGTAVHAIDAVLAKGPKAEQAGHVAVAAKAMATKATARATRANATAAAATARADALQHGTGDATITQPAPSAPAPSTTAPSALAATPGTPGSTTIR